MLLSSLYQEGKNRCDNFDHFLNDDDSLFFNRVFLAISSGNKDMTTFETSIYKLNTDESKSFVKKDKDTVLEMLTSIPEFLLINTSKFQHFIEGDSYEDQDGEL